MNEIVADALASSLSTLNFLSRVAGCVKTLKLPIGEGKFKRIPVSRIIHKDAVPNIIDCSDTEDYYDLIPNSGEIGILYFEDLGSRHVRVTPSGNVWKGQLRLVCWLNMNQIGDANPAGTFRGAVRQALPTLIGKGGYFLGGRMKVLQEDPKSFNPFSKYDYDEERTQYLIYPFDYFSMKIGYTAVIAKNCEVVVDVTPKPC